MTEEIRGMSHERVVVPIGVICKSVECCWLLQGLGCATVIEWVEVRDTRYTAIRWDSSAQ